MPQAVMPRHVTRRHVTRRHVTHRRAIRQRAMPLLVMLRHKSLICQSKRGDLRSPRFYD